MTQHTLGPWTIQAIPHPQKQRAGDSYAIRDARNCCLAEVGHVDAIHDGAESEANARLIAKAPEMVKFITALKNVRGTLDIDDVNTGYNVSFREWTRALLKEIEGTR